MKKIITLALLFYPFTGFAKPIPLDHFYTRLPTKTYNQIAQDSRLINSNLFYPNMNQDRGEYQGHYLNGLQSYFEIFDAAKIDKMKYVAGVYVGLGFLGVDHTEFDRLFKRIQKNVSCEVTRFDFHPEAGDTHFLVCRKGDLRLHVFQFEPKKPNPDPTRLSSAQRVRQRANYTKTPIADEILEINLTANQTHTKVIGEFLTNLGWKKKGKELKWCLAKQCVNVSVANQIQHPAFEKVIFSTTENTKEIFLHPHFKIEPKGNMIELNF